MITISKAYSFDSSHMLWDTSLNENQNWEVFGKCSRLHGHTYTLDVTITGEVDPRTGMILNYFDLDKIVKPIVDRLDHFYLNDIFDCLPTAENLVERIALLILDELAVRSLHEILVDLVSLQETPKTSATWMPG